MLAHELAWTLQPGPAIAGLVSLALFAQGFVRLRRRAPEHAGWDRPVLFLLAVACGTLPLLSPLDGYADEFLLSAQGRSIVGCLYGSSRPHIDFPKLARLHLAGRLPIDRLVTHRGGLDDVNAAFARMRVGEGARTVLTP